MDGEDLLQSFRAGLVRIDVNGADDGRARNVQLPAQPGDADGGFAGEALGVEAAFAGDAEVGAGEAVAEAGRVDHDVDAAAQGRAEEREHPEPQPAGGTGAGGVAPRAVLPSRVGEAAQAGVDLH